MAEQILGAQRVAAIEQRAVAILEHGDLRGGSARGRYPGLDERTGAGDVGRIAIGGGGRRLACERSREPRENDGGEETRARSAHFARESTLGPP